jgi:hypothetical protein
LLGISNLIGSMELASAISYIQESLFSAGKNEGQGILEGGLGREGSVVRHSAECNRYATSAYVDVYDDGTPI